MDNSMKTKQPSNPAHTDTPWVVSENVVSLKIGPTKTAEGHAYRGATCVVRTPSMLDIDRANAAFIVRAVNAHEEFKRTALVSIHRAEQALNQLGPSASPVVREWLTGIIAFNKEALAHAEGK